MAAVNVMDRLAAHLFTVKALAETGIIRPVRPDRVVAMARAFARWGATPAAGYTVSALRHPDRVGIVDELGTLTFGQLDQRTNALAHALRGEGVGEGDGVAVMCRNHRGFVETTVAVSKLGANALYLNTQFAGPQITEVCAREKPVLVVYDEEFAGLCAASLEERKGIVAWSDGENPHGHPLLEDLVASGRETPLGPPAEKGRVVILTSGTTGTPKGASRKQPESLAPAAALFSKIPLRARQHTHIAAPLFHSWGFAHFTLGMALGSTLVLRRKWTPEGMLNAVAEHACTTLAVVPVMLARTLEQPDEVIGRYDVSCLKVIAASGSALPGELALRVMDRFGDVLYNLYGSTEVAWATIAGPADMRAAPGTAGSPPRGTVVRLYDEAGRAVPQGRTGRIFVGNEMIFDGYTGGGDKERIQGLMSTGDVGHFDRAGRLFVDGRDDEMIVSGGENVFPREVEDLLADHEAIQEASVLGVADAEFGQRLKAFVVVRRDHRVTEDDLKSHIRSRLASFKVPREIDFLDELPRNATGKVVKRELEQH